MMAMQTPVLRSSARCCQPKQYTNLKPSNHHPSIIRNAIVRVSSSRTRSSSSSTKSSSTKSSRISSSCGTSGTSGSTSGSSTATGVPRSMLDALVMEIDGFNPSKAQAVYPPLQEMPWDAEAQANLEQITQLLPPRLHGQLFTNHPQLLETDVQSWLEFLTSLGLSEQQVADVLRACPEVLYRSNIFQAGQLLLFLRGLQVPEAELLGSCFKWAAALRPDATQEGMAAVAECLQQRLGLQDQQQLLTALQRFPEVLCWDVQQELLPKLDFFESLPDGRQLLKGTLFDEEGDGWFQGLRSWHYTVQPKLQLLQRLLGSEQEAQALVSRCPGILKLPVETKLQPVLTALAGVGLDGQQLAQLLRDCPKLLAEPKDSIISRINFLSDAVGSDVLDLLACPGVLLLSLADTTGPRYYFLARSGHLAAFSDPRSGALQLERVLQSPLDGFLADVSQVAGDDLASVEAEYSDMKVEWDNLLGWCCEKAFSSTDGSIPSMYTEAVNLFYVLVQ